MLQVRRLCDVRVGSPGGFTSCEGHRHAMMALSSSKSFPTWSRRASPMVTAVSGLACDSKDMSESRVNRKPVFRVMRDERWLLSRHGEKPADNRKHEGKVAVKAHRRAHRQRQLLHDSRDQELCQAIGAQASDQTVTRPHSSAMA
jgi:hypothetical protein